MSDKNGTIESVIVNIRDNVVTQFPSVNIGQSSVWRIKRIDSGYQMFFYFLFNRTVQLSIDVMCDDILQKNKNAKIESSG